MKKWVLEEHTPVEVDDVVAWGRWFETADRQVASTLVGAEPNPVRVSTVFLGIDHAFGRGRPLLFETMIFGSDHPDLEHYQERYATWAEAEAGHARAVALVETILAGAAL